jgi:hypothetical protein
MSLLDRKEAPTKADAKVMGTPNGITVKNTSYRNIDPVNLPQRDPDYAYERDRSLNHKCKDGVYPMTPEEQAAEREVSWKLVKQFTKNIFSMNFTNFSFPAAYSEPRSFLERTADIFAFLGDSYIDKCGAETDPDKKLLILAAGIVGGFYIYMQAKKPWNPVLGETYVGGWETGAKIYSEQTSHHPPISDTEIIGKDNKWRCTSHCNFTIDSGMREVDINQNGTFHLEFADGNVYEWEFPIIQVFGIIYGDRIIRIKGPVIIKDLKNNLTCEIQVQPKKDKAKGITESVATTIYAFTYATGEKKPQQRKAIIGDFTDKLVYADTQEEVWNINTNIIKRPIAEAKREEMLPSDSRFRLDRCFLIQGNQDAADSGKVTIEEAQRREEKLRIKV